MGFPKAWLPFGDEVMLQRVVRLLGEVVAPIVVVASPGQELPSLPAGALIADDRREGRGPLEGLLAGLGALQGRCEAAYASSCDAPRLVPAFVRRMTELLAEHEIAVPCESKFCHPLAAVYRLDVLATIESLLNADQLRPRRLFDEVDTRRVPVDELRDVDPELHTLANLNHPSDYTRALMAEGLAPPQEIVEQLAKERGAP